MRVSGSLPSHGVLDFIRGVGQCAGKVNQLTRDIHIKDVFNAHTQLFFWDVDPRLDREYHSRADSDLIVAFIMHI